MPFKTLFLFVTLCSSLVVSGQSTPDSLLKNYQKFWGIAQSFRIKGNPNDAIAPAQRALELAIRMKDTMRQGNSLHQLGLLHASSGNGVRALQYYKENIALQRLSGNMYVMAQSYNGIGNLYLSLGDLKNAVDNIEKCVNLYYSIGDSSAALHFERGLGSVYGALGEFDKSLSTLHKALKFDLKTGATKWVLADLRSIANTYLLIGDYHHAIDFAEQAMRLAKEEGIEEAISNVYVLLSRINREQGNSKEALEFADKANASFEHVQNKQILAHAYGAIGAIYNEHKIYQKAIDVCSRGYALAIKENLLNHQLSNCACLVQGYKALKDDSKALHYLERQTAIQDSLSAINTSHELQKMELENVQYQDSLEAYQVELKHKEVLSQKNKSRNLALMAGILALILAGGFYARWRFVKRSKAILEEEKSRSDNLLLNILPVEIAEELKVNGRADARDYAKVSILFTDFKGFTGVSEQLTAKDLVHNINQCFEAFDEIVDKYGIEKIKTIGDAYMAAGGLPIQSPTSVTNTVLAALELQAFISALKIDKESRGEHAFEMRVGIHTGPVVAGIVGVKKFQYDVWGDTVNTASRMESHGEVGKVNISQATYELIKNDPQFRFEPRGKVEAKGKGEINMYFVYIA